MEYFGKGCEYFVGQWEEQYLYESGDERYKNSQPDLVFCNHIDNRCETEGNCNKIDCPLNKDIK